MSDLVGNPEDRFSQNEAHLLYKQLKVGIHTEAKFINLYQSLYDCSAEAQNYSMVFSLFKVNEED